MKCEGLGHSLSHKATPKVNVLATQRELRQLHYSSHWPCLHARLYVCVTVRGWEGERRTGRLQFYCDIINNSGGEMVVERESAYVCVQMCCTYNLMLSHSYTTVHTQLQPNLCCPCAVLHCHLSHHPSLKGGPTCTSRTGLLRCNQFLYKSGRQREQQFYLQYNQ